MEYIKSGMAKPIGDICHTAKTKLLLYDFIVQRTHPLLAVKETRSNKGFYIYIIQ